MAIDNASTFTKQERLCSVKDIQALCSEGKSLFSYPFKVIYRENTCSTNRIIVSVPKKMFKRAVKRNLLKRRMREAYRLNKGIIAENCGNAAHLDILFVYISKDIIDYAQISAKIAGILEKIAISVPDRGSEVL